MITMPWSGLSVPGGTGSRFEGTMLSTTLASAVIVE